MTAGRLLLRERWWSTGAAIPAVDTVLTPGFGQKADRATPRRSPQEVRKAAYTQQTSPAEPSRTVCRAGVQP